MLLPFILSVVLILILLICHKVILIQGYNYVSPAESAMIAARQSKYAIDPTKTRQLARKSQDMAIQANLSAEEANQKAQVTGTDMDWQLAKFAERRAKDATFVAHQATTAVEEIKDRCDVKKANIYLATHILNNTPFQSQKVQGCGVRGYMAGSLDKGDGYKLCGKPRQCYDQAVF